MSFTSRLKNDKFRNFTSSAIARPLALIVIIGLVFGGVAIANHFKHDKYADARKAADTFLQAYTNCDVATAKKYYVQFQTEGPALERYKQQCMKGAISFSFDSYGTSKEKTDKGVRSINTALFYNISEKSSPPTKVMVYMIWSSDHKQWTVFGITAASRNPAARTPAPAS